MDAVVDVVNSLGLSEPAKQALSALEMTSLGVPPEALLAVMSSDIATRAISELKDACLVEPAKGGLIKPTALIAHAACFPNALNPNERRAFHSAAAKTLAALAQSSPRDATLNLAVEANFHAALAGNDAIINIGGLVDGVSAAARREYEEGHPEQVIRLLSPLDETRVPEDILALLADSYAWCNQFTDAFRLAATVISKNRDYRWLYTSACKAALRARQLDHAKKAVALAEALEPGDHVVLVLKGRIALRSGRPDEAEFFFEKAVERSERDAWPHFYLARLLLERGNPERAVEIAELGREIVSKLPYSRGRRAVEHAILTQEVVGLVLTGEEQKAKACLDVIERSENWRPEVVLCIAYIQAHFAEEKSDTERIQAFNRALNKLRKSDARKSHLRAQICLFRGRIYEQLSNFSEAETEYAEACKLDTFNVFMKMCYAALLYRIARHARDHGSREAADSAAQRSAQVVSDLLRLHPGNQTAINLQEDLFSDFRVQ